MGKFIEELISLIRREEQVLKAFLNLLNLQKQYLLANEIEQFQGTVERQEVLIDEIKELETKRIEKVREMAAVEGLQEDEITLTHLIEITLGDVSEELKKLKQSLSKLVEKIRRANRVNGMLIKRSLDIIQQSVGWMIDAADISSVYDPHGRSSRQAGTNVIVNKVL
jgi:flagellar biosynthesis/type III secretory pathway chaperone